MLNKKQYTSFLKSFLVLRWVNVSNKLKQPIILVGIYSKCIKVQIGNVSIIALKFSPFDGESCECVGILDIKNQ